MCQKNILPLLNRADKYKSSEIGAMLYGININNSPYSTQALALMANKCLKYLHENGQIHYYYKNGKDKLWYIV